MSSTPSVAGRRSVLTLHLHGITQCAILARLSSHTYTYTHCALLTHLHLHSLRPTHTPTPTLTAPLLGWQSPHAFKIASALVGGLAVYFLLGGLITEYVQSLVK